LVDPAQRTPDNPPPPEQSFSSATRSEIGG
jgi:hypothetical protein